MPTLIHILPHAGIEKRIAGEPEPGDVVLRRQVLVGDADIDVADIDDVAGVLRGAVVVLFRHGVALDLAPGRLAMAVAAEY